MRAGSVDAAAIWADLVLPAKNSLLAADAQKVENAFQARLAELELGVDNAMARPLARISGDAVFHFD